MNVTEDVLISEVLSRLTVEDLLRLCQVERRFAAICQRDRLWQLLTERDRAEHGRALLGPQ